MTRALCYNGLCTSRGDMTEHSHLGKQLAVELHGITKRFPGVIANHDVELIVRPGTIHAIVGENGAGKSTTMRMPRSARSAASLSVSLVIIPER